MHGARAIQMAKGRDLPRPLPKNTCKGKRPKQEVVEQLCRELEAYLNGLLVVPPASPPASKERLDPTRELLDFLEYRSRGIVSVVKEGGGRGKVVLSTNTVESGKGFRLAIIIESRVQRLGNTVTKGKP